MLLAAAHSGDTSTGFFCISSGAKTSSSRYISIAGGRQLQLPNIATAIMLFRSTAITLLALLPATLAQDASSGIPSGAVVDPPAVSSFPPAESFPPEISANTPATDPTRTSAVPDLSAIESSLPNITGSVTIQPIGTFAPTPTPSVPAVAAGNDSIPDVLVPYVQKYLSNITFYFPKKGDWCKWIVANVWWMEHS